MAAGRRSRSHQDGVGSRTAVVATGVAVAIVAGGGWAIAQSGGSDSTSGAGSSTTSTTPTPSPSDQPPKHHHQNTAWSKSCGKAATAAAHDGYGVMAPSELPAGWTLRSCRYTAATGWHMVVQAGQQTLSVDQRKGAAAPVVAAVLGPGSTQGKDVHAQGTGTWQSWAGSGGKHALSRTMTTSGVVVSGRVGVSTLNRLAGVLLTYENAPNGNNGG